MYLFWDTAIRPILQCLQPKTILEIGSDRGHTTERLLAYCQQNQASLHVIDPLPKYNVEAWKERYGDAVTFHRELSLNALAIVPAGELVLVDGDHNWYTVFHELKLIEKRCEADGKPFPVILLHDIDWPYGRRDLYYNPENIPPGYRHAHKQLGLCLNSPGLLESGGFNSHLEHSIYENNLQNGVRTAIEDFLESSPLKMNFYNLAGFHGLGILITDTCCQGNPQLADFLKSLETSAEVYGLMQQMERQRLEGEVNQLQYAQEVKELKQGISGFEEKIRGLRRGKTLDTQKHQEEVEALRFQIESLKQANQHETGKHQEEVGELIIQIENLRQINLNETSKRQEDAEALGAQIETLKQANQEEVGELTAQIENLKRVNLDETDKHQKEIAKLGTQIEALKQANQDEVGKHQEEAEALGAQIEALKQANQDEIGKYQEEVQSLGAQMERLKQLGLEEANKHQKETKSLESQTKSLTAQIENLRQINLNEISEYQQEICELRARAESLQRNNLSEASKYKRQTEELELQIESLEQVNQDEASRYQKEFDEIRDRYSQFARHSEQDIRWLIGWVEELSQSITSILNTNRWKVGNFLYTAYRKIRIQSLDESPESQLSRLMEGMRAWEKQYEVRRDQEQLPDSADLKVGFPKKEVLESKALQFEQAVLMPSSMGKNGTASVNAPTNKVDIVVCIHNALDDVRLCLESIERETSLPFHLHLVNDGSDEETTTYLRRFANRCLHCTLLEREVAGGYTVAANCGLQASTSDCVVLLNSDTIATSNWLELLLECLHSDPKIGIVSPLSNAATWQSVPEISAPEGGWAINMLPSGTSPNDVAALVSSASQKQFPRVPFLNGFCLCLKRDLIDTIGYLDEEAFPRGYGEENDYCLRALDAGFTLAIADSAYVFHAKSKSYGKKKRSELAKAGNQALLEKHGQEKMASQLRLMKDNTLLGEIRDRIRQKLKEEQLDSHRSSPSASSRNGASPRILFLLPVRGGGGGAHSVVQEVMGMQKLGVKARVATKGKYKAAYQKNYPSFNVERDLCSFYSSKEDLVAQAGNYDIVIATIFTSVQLLQAILEKNPRILPAYYVQDYEPWFCQSKPSLWEEAYNSYTLIPETVLFAKTFWLCNLVKKEHGVEVAKVSPSLDRDLYYPSKVLKREDNVVRIAAMVRPATPRRGAARTMRVLSRVSEEFGKQVKIDIFGCEDSELECHAFPRNFPYHNHGILKREDVAELLRQADIFVDYSSYQAFGRTGLEAMACGCVTVLPLKGGTSEYASHEENALLANTDSEEDCYAQLAKLIIDSPLRGSLRERGLISSSRYSIEKAAMSELKVLKAAFERRVR